MKIIHIASECAPVAKAGGLGDVIQGLCKELAKQGHQVLIFLPHYPFFSKDSLEIYEPLSERFSIQEEKGCYEVSLYRAKIAGCDLILFDSNHPKKYFTREKIYGYKDDIERFLHFIFMCSEYLLRQKETVDILHLHDWHTSAFLLLMKMSSHKIKKTVFTIHNFEYQGKCLTKDLAQIRIDSQKIETDYPGLFSNQHVNLMKVGICLSDQITTVSPSYAEEILTPRYGFGLDETLKLYRGKLRGILNGIDTEYWNPAIDSLVPCNYNSMDQAKDILKAKKQNKAFLFKKLGLEETDSFLVSSVGRLVAQKGPFLISKALEYLAHTEHSFILLGTPSNSKIKCHFEQLKHQFENGNLKILFEYDEPIAHLIYAASDFIIMPSLFEPCGLSQRIALMYGTIPIVRKTGGLKDTVFDLQLYEEKGNGFVFEEEDPLEMLHTIQRALETGKKKLSQLQKKVMKIDPSWSVSASEYSKIYHTI